MASYKARAGLFIAALIIALFVGWIGLPGSTPATSSNSLDWRVDEDGRLSYQFLKPEFNLSEETVDANSSLIAVQFASRGAEIAGLLRIPTIRFYRSIDPDTYLPLIAPRPLAMIHSRNDTVIPYPLAVKTYALASQPKSLTSVGCTVHGYCQEMDEGIEKELRDMVS